MDIERVEHHDPEELIRNMRNVGMLTDPEAKLYRNSAIELVTLHTDEIAPAQRYVLTQEILKVRDLRWALRDHGIDLFRLDGYITMWFRGYDDPIDLLPPSSPSRQTAVWSKYSTTVCIEFTWHGWSVLRFRWSMYGTCRRSTHITHTLSSMVGPM